MQGLGQLGFDLQAALRWIDESIQRSRSVGFIWAESLGLTFDGILHAVAGDLGMAKTRYSQTLEIQRRLGDEEGAGLSLGGLAQLAAGTGDLAEALDLYAQSLAAFEAVSDRAEEARILSEMAWVHLRHEDREC